MIRKSKVLVGGTKQMVDLEVREYGGRRPWAGIWLLEIVSLDGCLKFSVWMFPFSSV